MTQAPTEPTRLSKSALASLICGILGCIPFVTGGLAILLGLVGFIMAGKPGMKGRWMAVVGALLGMVSLVIWTLGGASLVWAYFQGKSVIIDASAPALVAHDFIKDLAAGDAAGAKVLGPSFDDAAIGRLVDYCKDKGTFVDTDFNTSIDNDTAHLDGTAKFSSGEQHATIDLEQNNGKWQVTKIDLKRISP